MLGVGVGGVEAAFVLGSCWLEPCMVIICAVALTLFARWAASHCKNSSKTVPGASLGAHRCSYALPAVFLMNLSLALVYNDGAILDAWNTYCLWFGDWSGSAIPAVERACWVREVLLPDETL